MTIKSYKPTTPGTRHKTSIDFFSLTKKLPEKSLTCGFSRKKGRNNQGKITVRHKGGGHKRRYRIIDFKRDKKDQLAEVIAIEYDPNRNVNIALLKYKDSEKRYILQPEKLVVGNFIIASKIAEPNIGNNMPLKEIPVGTEIHGIELYPGRGAQLARAAGTFAKILAHEKSYSILILSSKEVRKINNNCTATIGKLGNLDYYRLKIGKAGRNRWLGIRPSVRGSAMNAIDHPHGGGEGKSPIGHSHPLTPWGKAALGVKTRKKNKKSNIFIIRK